jgi:predicted DNA-binding ribbon-helix-helix protein
MKDVVMVNVRRYKRVGRSIRSFMIAGHWTTVRLEHAFWNALKEIADRHSVTVGALGKALTSPGGITIGLVGYPAVRP